MCNRYRAFANEAAIAATFGVFLTEDLSLPSSELFPKRPGLVLNRGNEPLVPDVMS